MGKSLKHMNVALMVTYFALDKLYITKSNML